MAAAETPVTEGRCHCGAASWRVEFAIPDATICNCTICRRTGALWTYGYDGVDVHVTAPEGGLAAYAWGGKNLTYNFCKTCGNLVSWRGLKADEEGRIRLAVNLRLAEPEAIARIPLQRFEGLVSFEDLPKDGRCIGDVVF